MGLCLYVDLCFMHHPYLVCILFGMPSLHLFTFLMFFYFLVYICMPCLPLTAMRIYKNHKNYLSDNMSLWPQVEYGHIFAYFIEHPGVYTQQQLLSWKQLEFYNFARMVMLALYPCGSLDKEMLNPVS